jgi:hypothetical protein
MICAEATCPAALAQQWRTVVHSSILNARIYPGSPFFTATAHHLQHALTAAMGPVQAARVDHFTAVAVLGALGVRVPLLRRVFL